MHHKKEIVALPQNAFPDFYIYLFMFFSPLAIRDGKIIEIQNMNYLIEYEIVQLSNINAENHRDVSSEHIEILFIRFTDWFVSVPDYGSCGCRQFEYMARTNSNYVSALK